MQPRTAPLLCLVLAVAPLAVAPLAAEESASVPELNDQNYTAWRDHILPEESELAWEKIPWLTTFKDGIIAANDAGKPLLFWTMNGHPLGCT